MMYNHPLNSKTPPVPRVALPNVVLCLSNASSSSLAHVSGPKKSKKPNAVIA